MLGASFDIEVWTARCSDAATAILAFRLADSQF